MFIVLAKMYKMKVVVFFRGWDSEFEKIFEKKYLRLFRKLFFRANAFIELSSKHKNLWNLWGYKKNIYLETTLVDKSLVEGLTFEEVGKKYENIEELNILFLARIETNKGVYEAVDTFILLKEKYPRAKLSIAGDGKEINNLVTYIKNRGVKDIVFLGHVSGKQKTDCYKKSHIYLFPSYSEGMPNTVLEAMAFGIPVVTRKVGGLNDFFQNDVNGYFTNSKDPEVFAGFIEKLLDNKELLKAISLNNFKQGQEKFLSDKVAKRIEKIFDEVLDEKSEGNKLDVKNKNKKDQKRILILVPGKNARGGISNYYYAIKNGFNMPVDYFVRGARNYPFRRPYFKDVMQAAIDIINFIRIVRKKKHGLVQTSTSLDERSVIRDCVFILIASFYKIDVIVFYRGWKLTFQDRLEKSYLGIFRKIFFKAKIFIVLSREFKEKLLEWGYDKPIYVETTLVDSELIKDFKPENAIKKYSSVASPKLLFLSRVEVAKGIY
jgi:glycosyltransferase involved in cell wall biosynthesis